MKKAIKTIFLCFAFTTVLLTSVSAANLGGGQVTASSLNFRSEASTDATVIACVNYGAHVVLTGETSDNWYTVLYEGIRGYMYSAYVEKFDTLDFIVGCGKVKGDGVRIRAAASYDSATTTYLYQGDVVNVVGVSGEWYEIDFNGNSGYVHSDYIDILPSGEGTPSRSLSTSVGTALVDFAKEFLGTTYVYGGSRPGGFDCSGFTYYLFNQSGYAITRTASSQWYDGVNISKDELAPGDLVFFSSSSSTSIEHVGMYIGDGQFIHSSSGGGCVKINNLSDNYYLNHFYGAVRII